MKLIETRGAVAADGSIVLKPGVLETMEVQPGDTICLTYLGDKSIQAANSYSHVLLTKDGVESITEPFDPADEPELCLPHTLLEAAEIPLDGELSIQCLPGMIVIGNADPLDLVPPGLMKLFEELGVDPDTVRAVLMEGGL